LGGELTDHKKHKSPRNGFGVDWLTSLSTSNLCQIQNINYNDV